MLALVAVVGLSLTAVVRSLLDDEQQPNNSVSPAISQEQPKEPEKPKRPTIDAAEMQTRIKAIIQENPDVEVSVTMMSLTSNEQYQLGLNPSTVYEAASVAKVITATYYLELVEQRERKLSSILDNGKSAQATIEAMIVKSDNAAWHTLNDELTRPALTAYGKSIGLNSYSAELNRITPTDIATLLKKIKTGKLLNASNTKLLLDYMKRANRTDYIIAGLPSGTTVYHKAGWVEDRAHDAAIIEDGDSSYVLVIFTNGHGKPHVTDRPTILQDIATASYAHFITSEGTVDTTAASPV